MGLIRDLDTSKEPFRVGVGQVAIRLRWCPTEVDFLVLEGCERSRQGRCYFPWVPRSSVGVAAGLGCQWRLTRAEMAGLLLVS